MLDSIPSFTGFQNNEGAPAQGAHTLLHGRDGHVGFMGSVHLNPSQVWLFV